MDRLVFGDVGFGKTEMAIRAALLAVRGGRQVAVGRGVSFELHVAASPRMRADAVDAMDTPRRWRTREGSTPSTREGSYRHHKNAGPRADDGLGKATFECFQKKTGPAQRLRGTVGRAATRRNGRGGPAEPKTRSETCASGRRFRCL